MALLLFRNIIKSCSYIICILICGILLSGTAHALEKSKLKKINFETNEIKSTLYNLKKYPFLRDTLNEDNFSNTEIIKTKNYIKEMKLKDKTIILLKQTGSLQCGAHGCPVSIYYKNSDNSYTLLNTIIVQQFLYVACNKELPLISKNNSSFGVFRILYQKDKPKIKEENYKTLQEIPSCIQK